MKYLSAPFAKLLTVAACALTLGSCNRAEYAMLPKTSSYHGVARVSAPVPVAPVAAATPAPAARPEGAPEVAPETSVAAVPAPAAVEVSRPEVVAAPAVVPAAAAATVATTAPAPKLTRVQRFAATRLVKKVSKAANIPMISQHLATAETQAISGNLRTGVVLLLIGLLISLFSGVNKIFGLIGGVIAIIGLIFIILYLLDSI